MYSGRQYEDADAFFRVAIGRCVNLPSVRSTEAIDDRDEVDRAPAAAALILNSSFMPDLLLRAHDP